MKKTTQFFILLLMLVSYGWVSAEELTVKVAGDRTAVLHLNDKAGDPDVSGTVKGALNLKEGKSGWRADLTLKNNQELQGAEADFFAQMTGETIEMIGYMNIKVPPEPDAPKVLDMKIKSVTEGDNSAADFTLDLVAPAKGEAVPKGKGTGKFSGDMTKFSMSGDFDFSDIPMGDEVPLTSLEINIAEAGDAPVKTTISFAVGAQKDSPTAGQLGQLSAMAPMLTGQLDQNGIKYEGVDFPAPTTEGDTTIGKGAITIVDIRGTLKPYLGIAAMQMAQELPPGTDAKGALEKMIEGRLDKFNLKLNFSKTGFNGTAAVDASNLKSFYDGYLAFMPALQQVGQEEMLRETGELRFILGPLLELSNEQSMANMRVLVNSSLQGEGEMKFNLEPKEGGDVSFSASGNMLAKNYSDYVKKAKAEGLPVAEKAVVKMDINLKDGTALVGDMYLFTDGDLAHVYKNMLSQAAAKANAPEDVKAAIDGFDFKELGFMMTLKDNKLKVETKSTTSDLTPIAKVALKQAAPHLEMDVTGVAVDVNMTDDGSGTGDLKIFYANFLPGKSADEIKEALGLPGSAQVTLDAPAGDVAMVAVEEPELAVAGQLASVQKEGKALLDTPPAAVAGGAGGEGGGSKTGLIVLGVLLLLGVGGFLAFGNKGS